MQQGGLLRGASYGRRHGDIVKAAAEAAKSPAVGRPAPAAGAQTWHPGDNVFTIVLLVDGALSVTVLGLVGAEHCDRTAVSSVLDF